MSDSNNSLSPIELEINKLEDQLKDLKLRRYTDSLPPPRIRRTNLTPEERIKIQCERTRAYYYKNRARILARQKVKRKANAKSNTKDDEILANVTLVL